MLASAGVAVAEDNGPQQCSTAWRGVLNTHDGTGGSLGIFNDTQVWNTGDRVLGTNNLTQQRRASCFAGGGSDPGDEDECLESERVPSFEDLGLLPSRPNENFTAADNINVGPGEIFDVDADINPEEVIVQPGGELRIHGDVTINVEGDFQVGQRGQNVDRAKVTVNAGDGGLTRVFADDYLQENADTNVTSGDYRLITDRRIRILADSDMNCGQVASDGDQRSCSDTSGNVFGISRSTGTFRDSRIRGAYYVDGTQFSMTDVVLQGAATGGSINLQGDSHVTQGKLPNTEGFCEQPGPGNALVTYRMEEPSWSGDSGEVRDATGNGWNATAFGNANTADDSPAIEGDPGTCGYGAFDGDGSYIEDSNASEYLEGLAGITMLGWIRNRGGVGNNNGIVATAPPSGEDDKLGFRFDASGDFTGDTSLIKASINTDCGQDGEDTCLLQVESEGGVQGDDEWQHIAFVWETDKKIRIFLNGREIRTTVTDSGVGIHNGTIDGVEFLRIGRSGVSADDDWHGDIDEFMIFDGPLTALEIQRIRDETHPCELPVAGYEVGHSATGLTCEPVSVTVTAIDEAGDPVDADGATVGLFTDTNNGTWSRLLSGGGSFNPGADGSGEAEYTFAAGESSAEFSFNYPVLPPGADGETVTLIADDGDATGAGDPPLTIALSGFRFIDRDSGEEGIPHQVSGKPSFESPNSANLGLQALEATDDDPSVCAAAFPDGAELDVLLAGECDDPSVCAGEMLQINGEAVATADGAPIVESDYTPVSLEFGVDATAPLDLNYFDAGATRLHALYEILLDDDAATDAGTPSGGFLRGSSNAFVWRPFGFHVDVAGNPERTEPIGPVFIEAGAEFVVTLSAVAWDGEDFDGEQPAVGADLSDNPVTPNFGNESSAPEATLTSDLVAPADGEPGILGADRFDAFADGTQQRDDVAWSEVGYIDILAGLDGTYLGTQSITGRAPEVGRFIPADFEQTVRNDGIFATGCDGSFTYIGQPFGYTTNPQLEIRPRNVDGAVTQNYTGDFARLTAADIPLTGPDEDDEQTLRDDDATPLRVDADLVTGSLVEDDDEPGVHIYTFADDDRYTYVRNFDPGETPDGDARISPFDGALTIAVDEFSDADDVTASSLVDVTPMGTQLRFGRMVLDGAVGSELAPLDLPVRIEVWDEDTWQVRADGCTTIVEDRILLTGSLDNETAPDEDRLPLAFDDDGRTELRLTAPGQTGFVDVELDLELALGADDEVITWLRDDLDADGQFVENPAARASFGLFGGNPRQIYREEVLR